jgi:hypothetical protein
MGAYSGWGMGGRNTPLGGLGGFQGGMGGRNTPLGGYGLGLDPMTEGALNTVASAVTTDPTVLQDRSRAAAAVDAGYSALDQYTQLQPVLFFVSVMGLIASGYGLYVRRKVPEGVALYSLTAVLSATSAWITRPAALRPAPTPAAAATATSPEMAGVLSYLDQRVANRTAQQPGWEAVTWNRLATDLGQTPLDPAIATLLTANSR